MRRKTEKKPDLQEYPQGSVRIERTPLCPVQVPHQRCRHRKVSWGFLPLIDPEAAGGELVGRVGGRQSESTGGQQRNRRAVGA